MSQVADTETLQAILSSQLAHKRLGEILIGQNRLSEAQLNEALEEQKRCHMPLGKILAGMDVTQHRDVRDALSIQHALPIADLLKEPPDRFLLSQHSRRDYEQLECLPWKQTDDGMTWIATTRPSDAIHQWAQRHFGSRYKLAVTSPIDIRRSLAASYEAEDTQDAEFSLYHHQPHRSAYTPSGILQRLPFILSLTLLAASFILAPQHALYYGYAFLCAFYGLMLAFKGWLFVVGKQVKEPETPPLLTDAQLPVYTLLIPLYREDTVLPSPTQGHPQTGLPQSQTGCKADH